MLFKSFKIPSKHPPLCHAKKQHIIDIKGDIAEAISITLHCKQKKL